MTAREWLYASLAVLGLTGTWYFNLQLFQKNAGLDPIAFLRLGFVNAGSSSMTVDLLVAFAAFCFWVVPEAARLGMRRGWLYPVVGLLIAFAFAFPLFLLLRERKLRGPAVRVSAQ